ncbi:uncharacterized protein RSE6_02425 [Rhynchosporium secalis]|uniref:Uncharacterized protein n=1 Tax=Rhynchosporium secalis TaxID=38038 RepID=A0A1E1M0A3_RHYSE|nr:uncharacterized protein RSE6_02425 [Rhynchosporium secalis]
MKSIIFATLACTAFALNVPRQVSHPELKGMTVFGYQGWYPIRYANNTGTNFKWFSPPDVTPGPPNYPRTQVLTDVLPYTADYAAECLLDTNFILANGQHAKFYTSYCTSVIEAHFQYMVKYKIDGIFVQRFFDAATPSNEFYQQFLFVLNTVRTMAEKYGKYFAVEYDFSGKPADWDPNLYMPILVDDYVNILVPLFQSPSYIYSGGRPVVELWGAGINPDGLTGSKWKNIVTAYLEADEHPFVILGIPHNWLDYRTPSRDPTGYWAAYQIADCLQPWPVGAFSNVGDLEWSVRNELVPGKAQADAMGVKYSGAFTPGGSNRNAARSLNNIPPLGNRQLKVFSNNTIKPFFNFGAMFDEYTEATQILPMLKNSQLPTNSNPGFLGTDDNMDIFLYMALSGKYTTAFHGLWGQAPLSV